MISRFAGPAFVFLLLGAQTVASTAIAAAGNPDITVKVATISSGRLVIMGMASAPRTVVRIDGTQLAVAADAARVFRFDVNYRTPDCVVTLATPKGRTNVLVGDCGPMGVVPRGSWTSNRRYVPNELVVDGGSSWRACGRI